MCMTAAIIGSAAIGGIASSSAANSQERAAEKSAKVQKEIYKDQKKLFAPYYQGGLAANRALMYELGLGPHPDTFMDTGQSGGQNHMGPFGRMFGRGNDQSQPASTVPYEGFRATPGYDFRFNEGIRAIDASGASGGNLFSGASGKALTEFGQNIGAQEYGNYLNRLTGMAASGQNAAGQQAAAGQNYATGMSQAYSNIGNAQAAGAIGIGNAVSGGVNNYLGYQQMQALLA